MYWAGHGDIMPALTPAEFATAVQDLIDHETSTTHGHMLWERAHGHPSGDHEHLFPIVIQLLRDLGYEEGTNNAVTNLKHL